MLEIIKNMFRRKTRTVLTISGIAIGIFAFVVMGSMAEKINLLVSGGVKYSEDKVIVNDKSGNVLSLNKAVLSVNKATDIIDKVNGVQAVQAEVMGALDDKSVVSINPAMYTGNDEKDLPYEKLQILMAKGEKLQKNDHGHVMIGSDLVKKLNAEIGKIVRIKNKDFVVKGIMAKTMTFPDNRVVMTLEDAQNLYYNLLPDVLKSKVKPDELVTALTVYVQPNTDPEEVAKNIEEKILNVKALGPKEFQEQITSAMDVFNYILFGIAGISLLVGGLSVINTMIMSISERTKEIGIKKVVGAKTRNVMTEYLTEAGLIGFFGGVLGWLIGFLTITVTNQMMEESGKTIFLLSTRVTFFSIGFAVVLGVLAGIYPAYHAVKINIVKALREK